MILPNKHIKTRNSLLGIGAMLLNNLQRPQTVTQLWERANKIPEIESFEKFSLALDFLFIINAVELNRGLLQKLKK
jgi:hypothetical protein